MLNPFSVYYQSGSIDFSSTQKIGGSVIQSVNYSYFETFFDLELFSIIGFSRSLGTCPAFSNQTTDSETLKIKLEQNYICVNISESHPLS